jgi:hypothetical protein
MKPAANSAQSDTTLRMFDPRFIPEISFFDLLLQCRFHASS